MTVVRVQAPAATPVSLADVKLWLRVDHSDDDSLIMQLIAAATDTLDGTGLLGQAIVTQTWRQICNEAPSGELLELELGPVQSIAGVEWTARDGSTVTGDPADFSLATDGGKWWVRSAAWPRDLSTAPGALRIDFVAGFGDSVDVPAAIKTALMLLIGHWYEHREATGTALSEIPMGVRDLIERYRHGYAA